MKNLKVYGAVEAGGTKFVCGVGSSPEYLYTESFPTESPKKTLSRVISFFKEHSVNKEINAIGIGSFGPIDMDTESSKYGFITSTPKKQWVDTDFVGEIKKEFDVPIGFNTDVNAAALGEFYWGNAKDISDFIYLTVGTGIGGGGMVNGSLIHGLSHPEMGHIFIPKLSDDSYKGICPFHKDLCLEGLASGSAIQDRWGVSGQYLNEDHPAWELQSYYMAIAIMNYICTLSPRKIIIGGGVMKNKRLMELIREKVKKEIGGYLKLRKISSDIHSYIQTPLLGDNAGVLGALALAMQAYKHLDRKN